MVKINGEEIYLFHQYINKIVDRYDDNLIDGEKFQQYLTTLGRWEVIFKRLPKGRQKELLEIFGWVD